jgi:hypothetical protein
MISDRPIATVQGNDDNPLATLVTLLIFIGWFVVIGGIVFFTR